MFRFSPLSCNQDLTSSLKSRPAPPLISPGICHNAFSTLTSPLLTHLSAAQDVQSSVLKSPGSHHSDEPVDFAIVVRDFALQPRVESSEDQAQTQRQRAHSGPSDSLLQGFLVQEVVASSAVVGMSPMSLGEVEDDEWEDAVSEDDSVGGMQMKEARLKHAQRKRFGASLERTNAVEPVLDSSECAISSGSDDEGRSPKLTFQRQLIRSRTVSSLTERIQSSGDLLAFSTAPVQPKTNPELRQDSPPAPLLPSEETIERLNAVVFSPDPYGRWAW